MQKIDIITEIMNYGEEATNYLLYNTDKNTTKKQLLEILSFCRV